MTQSIELKFSRGVFVPGTITEAVSGKPAAGALVQYAQTTKNSPLLQRGGLPHSEAVSDSAGKFQIVVPAGPGHLLVRAANPDYLHFTATNEELGIRTLPNALMYPDALAHIDIKPGRSPDHVKLKLRRRVTVAGRVIGPDGLPITSAIALGRTYIPYKVSGTPFTFFTGNAPQIKVRRRPLRDPWVRPRETIYVSFPRPRAPARSNRRALRQIRPERTGNDPAREVRHGKSSIQGPPGQADRGLHGRPAHVDHHARRRS